MKNNVTLEQIRDRYNNDYCKMSVKDWEELLKIVQKFSECGANGQSTEIDNYFKSLPDYLKFRLISMMFLGTVEQVFEHAPDLFKYQRRFDLN